MIVYSFSDDHGIRRVLAVLAVLLLFRSASFGSLGIK